MTKKQATYKSAVALEYDQSSDYAPIIGAKGELISADHIVKIARRFGIPIVERGALAEALSKLEVNQEIPAELFEAVALVLNQIDQNKTLRQLDATAARKPRQPLK